MSWNKLCQQDQRKTLNFEKSWSRGHLPLPFQCCPVAKIFSWKRSKSKRRKSTCKLRRSEWRCEKRWEYFQAALERDQSQLKQVASAPQKLEAMKHRKQVAWRMSQAKQGEKVVKSFMEKYVRCDLVEKVEHAQQKVNEFRSFIAA